jgi:uncharacterized membrane protein
LKTTLTGNLDTVHQSKTSLRKWFRVLAAVTACLALVYPVVEAIDTTAITDSDFEFQVLTFLLVLGILVSLILLVLLALQMLMCGSVHMEEQRVSIRRCCPVFMTMVRPPGLDPLPSLRI